MSSCCAGVVSAFALSDSFYSSFDSRHSQLTMPAVARLDWVCWQLDYGRIIHIVAGQAKTPDKMKLQIILHPAADGTSSAFGCEHLRAQLLHLRQVIQCGISIDKGHKHSSGYSEVAIWISQPKTVFTPSKESFVGGCWNPLVLDSSRGSAEPSSGSSHGVEYTQLRFLTQLGN